ncbi:MAG: hypothetical protein ACXAEN_12300 [Candidatus Thorarchaeota archaeon]
MAILVAGGVAGGIVGHRVTRSFLKHGMKGAMHSRIRRTRVNMAVRMLKDPAVPPMLGLDYF